MNADITAAYKLIPYITISNIFRSNQTPEQHETCLGAQRKRDQTEK